LFTGDRNEAFGKPYARSFQAWKNVFKKPLHLRKHTRSHQVFVRLFARRISPSKEASKRIEFTHKFT